MSIKIGNIGTKDINMDNDTLNDKCEFLSNVMYQYLRRKGIHAGLAHSAMGIKTDNIDGSIVLKILISRAGPVMEWTKTRFGTYAGSVAKHARFFYIGLNEKGNGYLEDSKEVEFAEFELKKNIIESALGDLLIKMKF
ncbi:Hypothetical protein HVR_LOCUS900 [uncultured virus]|nr:Hypothetical protein HVR_LOCUS900 [uncultured virus]